MEASPAQTDPRPWPRRPARPAILDLPLQRAPLVQHLWVNGADVEEIAGRVRLKPAAVTAYLASRAEPRFTMGAPDVSLCATVESVAPEVLCRMGYDVRVNWAAKSSAFVAVTFGHRGVGRWDARWVRSSDGPVLVESRSDLARLIEACGEAASAWADRLRERLPWTHFSAAADRPKGASPLDAAGVPSIALEPLVSALVRAGVECFGDADGMVELEVALPQRSLRVVDMHRGAPPKRSPRIDRSLDRAIDACLPLFAGAHKFTIAAERDAGRRRGSARDE